MESIQTKIRKWGNSMGIIIPRDIANSQNLRENDTIVITIVKEANLSDVFSSLKRKRTGQNFKDEVRKGWGK